jgi:SAM-dependent methyltransferase
VSLDARTPSAAQSSPGRERGGHRTAARTASDSWYLDPVVARQKAAAFLALVDRWRDTRSRGATLKTDLFEEANGDDALAPHLAGRPLVGLDLDLRTAMRARRRFGGSTLSVFVTDLRALALRDGAVDLVVSPSTLDHFARGEDLDTALRELHRVLRPGGVAVVILDNPANPLYHVLRLVAPLASPFSLGHTRGRRRLAATLERLGFEVLGHDYAIHNPRGVLTLMNLLLRAVLRRWADRPIRGLLRAFALLDRLPTRSMTACFVAVGARRRGQPEAIALLPGSPAPHAPRGDPGRSIGARPSP